MLLDLILNRRLARLACAPIALALAAAGCATLNDQPAPAGASVELEPIITLSPEARSISFLDQVQLWAGPDARAVYAFSEMDADFEYLVTRSSTDGGRSWTEPVRLSPSGTQETRHHAFWIDRLPDGALGLLFWQRNMVTGKKSIFLSRSTDDGRSWSERPPQVDGASESFLPSIAAAADGRVLISWLDERSAPDQGRTANRVYKHYFSLSSDSGESWSIHDRRLPMEHQSRLVLSPESMISGPTLLTMHFVADSAGYGLEAYRSADAGANWSGVAIASDPYRSIFAEFAFLRRSGPPAFVFCQGKNRDANLVLASSNDQGQTWQTQVLTTNTDIAYHVPVLARSQQGTLALSWEQNVREAWVPMLSFSTDEGASWSKPIPVPAPARRETGFRTYPELAFDRSGALLVVWMDRVERRKDIYLNRTADLGQTWLDEPTKINTGTAATPDAWLPKLLALADGSALALWQERDATGSGPLLLRRFRVQP